MLLEKNLEASGHRKMRNADRIAQCVSIHKFRHGNEMQ